MRITDADGHRWPVTGHRWPVTGHRWPVTGHRCPACRLPAHPVLDGGPHPTCLPPGTVDKDTLAAVIGALGGWCFSRVAAWGGLAGAGQ